MPTLSLLMLLGDSDLAATLIARLKADRLLKDLVLLSDAAQESLDVQQERLPDVLILDLELQNELGADGLAMLHKLRTTYPEVRIIALFPAEAPEVKREAIKLGAFYTLAKAGPTPGPILGDSAPPAEQPPLDLDELVLAIRRAARARIEDAMVAVAYAESGDFDTVDAVMAPTMLPAAPTEGSAATVRALVAGEDPPFLEQLARRLTPRRVAVQGVVSCDRILQALTDPALSVPGAPGTASTAGVDVVVLNAAGNPEQCLETLRQIMHRAIPVEVILLADAQEADALSECTSLGAFDCLLHPVDVDHLVERLEDASHHGKKATPSQESAAESPHALGDHTATM